MKKREHVVVPRLPKAARDKLRSGGGHASAKDHSRQREKNALRKLTKESFCCLRPF